MRNVFISGAGRGLGLSLVRSCLATGDRVCAGIRRDSPEISGLQAVHRSSLSPVRLDVTDEESVAAASREATRLFGGLDLLINNAGILVRDTVDNAIEDLDFDSMRATFDVNLYGPLRVLKHFLPLLDRRPGAVVVNISSEAGSIADCGRQAWYDYCISKAGLNMASRILQNYLKERNVKVLAIHPGWMKTIMGGTGAVRDPEESARAILGLAARKWDMDDPIFVTDTGAPMHW